MILYPGGTAEKNSYIVSTFKLFIYAPEVILHSTRNALILRIVTGKSE